MQRGWNPADGFGRIKVTVSEALIEAPRDAVEKVSFNYCDLFKDIVCFSFQPAPLGKSVFAVDCTGEVGWRLGVCVNAS